MRKKILTLIAIAMVSTLLLASCGGGSKTYADGTYTAKSSIYESENESDYGNGYGEVTITIEGGIIVDADFKIYEVDGTLKDEDYGKINGTISNRDYYNKAQKAVESCDEYARMLVDNGQLDGVDAISGATINYDNFVEAVKIALKEAEE